METLCFAKSVVSGIARTGTFLPVSIVESNRTCWPLQGAWRRLAHRGG